MHLTYVTLIPVLLRSRRSPSMTIGRLCIWVTCVLLLGASCVSTTMAQTPHSVTRTCGYAGGPSCPALPPVVTPWTFSGYWFASTSPPMHSLAEVEAWMVSTYKQGHPNFCSMTLTSTVEAPGNPVYSSTWGGLETQNTVGLTWQVTVTYPAGAPPCSDTEPETASVTQTRSIQCPYGTSPVGTPSLCEPSGQTDLLTRLIREPRHVSSDQPSQEGVDQTDAPIESVARRRRTLLCA